MCGASYIREINEASLYNSHWHGERVQCKQNCANKSQMPQSKYVHVCECPCVSNYLTHQTLYVKLQSLKLLNMFECITGLQLTILYMIN